MTEVNRTDQSIYQMEVPRYERAYPTNPFIQRLIKEYLEDHPPKPTEKATRDLGIQGRTASLFTYHLASLATKVEKFFPPIGGSVTFGGNTAFQSGIGLNSAAQILEGVANTSGEIDLAKKSKTHTARGIHAMKASRGVITILYGAISTIQAGFALDAIKNTAAVVTNGLATLKAISGPLAGIIFSASMIPKYIELNKTIILKKSIKEGGIDGLKKLFLKNPGAIELVLPDVFNKLKAGEEITVKELEQISKNLNKSINEISILIGVSSLLLVLTVVGTILTSGAPLVLLIVGFLTSILTAVIDFKSITEMLKKAVKLTNKDIVIKVLTIVIALTAAVVSVVLSPSVGLQIAAGIVGGVLTLIPAVSLGAVSIKVKRLEEERKKQEAQEDYEKFIARALRRLAEKEFAINEEEKIQQRVKDQFFLLFKHPLLEKKVINLDKM